jgi:hypothetical protein
MIAAAEILKPSFREAGIKVAGPVRAIERRRHARRAAGRSNFVVRCRLSCARLRSPIRTGDLLGSEDEQFGCLEVDRQQRTTVPGIYAAGDVVSDLHQIAVVTGHAAIAATHIHKSLPENFKGPRTPSIPRQHEIRNGRVVEAGLASALPMMSNRFAKQPRQDSLIAER